MEMRTAGIFINSGSIAGSPVIGLMPAGKSSASGPKSVTVAVACGVELGAGCRGVIEAGADVAEAAIMVAPPGRLTPGEVQALSKIAARDALNHTLRDMCRSIPSIFSATYATDRPKDTANKGH